MNYSDLLLYGILFAALVMDFKSDKIPNGWIMTGYLAGLAVLFLQGETLWYYYVTDSIYILVICYVLYVAGVFGGGDAKLFAMIALWIGFERTVTAFVLAVIVGCICSVVKIFDLVRRGEFREKDFSHLSIHFALPIFLGTCLTEVISWNLF